MEKSFFYLLPSTAGITLKQSDNGGVILRSLDKLLKRQFTWWRQREEITLIIKTSLQSKHRVDNFPDGEVILTRRLFINPFTPFGFICVFRLLRELLVVAPPSRQFNYLNWILQMGLCIFLSDFLSENTAAEQETARQEVSPSRFVSICLKILSVRFSGVDSSSGIFITEETIL